MKGVILAMLGGCGALVTGYLGGHLSFARHVGSGERGMSLDGEWRASGASESADSGSAGKGSAGKGSGGSSSGSGSSGATLRSLLPARTPFGPGDLLRVAVRAADAHVFDAATGSALWHPADAPA